MNANGRRIDGHSRVPIRKKHRQEISQVCSDQPQLNLRWSHRPKPHASNGVHLCDFPIRRADGVVIQPVEDDEPLLALVRPSRRAGASP